MQQRHSIERTAIAQASLLLLALAGLHLTASAQTGDATLAPVTVTEEGEGRAARPKEFAGGQVARGSRIGMIGNQDLFTTPFSTRSYTSEFIRNQGARNADELVANDPSIRTSLAPTFVLDQSAIRGFLVTSGNYLFDGVPFLGPYYGTVPVSHFDRVEILKGPSTGLLAASGGSAGGSVNLVPKRATDTPVRSVTLSAQSRSLLGAHVDIGQRFGTDNAFGARLNLSVEDGDVYNGGKRQQVSPQIALDFRSQRFRAMLDAGRIDYDAKGLGTTFTMRPGAQVPAVPDAKLRQLPDWADYHNRYGYALLTLEADIAPNWTVYGRSGGSDNHQQRVNLSVGPLDSAGNSAVTSFSYDPWQNRRRANELGVRGNLTTGPVSHQFAVSALDLDGGVSAFGTVTTNGTFPTASIYRPYAMVDPYANGRPNTTIAPYTKAEQKSFAVADAMSMWDDRLHLTLALRRQTIRNGVYEQSRTTPTAAVLFKATESLSVYGNYAQGLTQGGTAPSTGVANPNQQLAPYVAKQHELGVKWNAGSYGITAAYFDIRQPSAYTNPATLVYGADGEQRNKGVELETFGEPVKGLRLLGGVAFIDAKQTKTAGGTFDGKQALGVAKWNTNLGAEWDVPGLNGFTLTGRVIHTGEVFVDNANTQRLPGWNRVDLGARYVTALAGNKLTVRAGITNLLDKAFWQSGGRNSFFVSAPRTFSVSTSVDF